MVAAEGEDGGVLNYCFVVMIDDRCLWKSSIMAEDNDVSNYCFVIREGRHR